MASWKIVRRQAACSDCEQPFAEDQVFWSLLRVGEEGFARVDLCASCFDTRDPEQDLFWWRTCHVPGKQALRMDPDALMGVMASLSEDSRSERLDFRFLLALLLVRHRRLRLLSVSRQGKREFLRLRRVRGKKEFEVEVRELDAACRDQLAGVLRGLLDPTLEPDLDELMSQQANND